MKTFRQHNLFKMLHGSDQVLSPRQAAELEAKFQAETENLLKHPYIPNPRYEIQHELDISPNLLPKFTLTFNAENPSTAHIFAHRFSDKLNIPLTLYDRHTQDSLLIQPPSATIF